MSTTNRPKPPAESDALPSFRPFDPARCTNALLCDEQSGCNCGGLGGDEAETLRGLRKIVIPSRRSRRAS
jgi:hypothetical protein